MIKHRLRRVESLLKHCDRQALAPRTLQAFQVPDHFWLAKAVQQAADFHMLMLLDLAANFWQWWGLWMIHGLRAESGQAGPKTGRRGPVRAEQLKEVRASGVARYYASRF